MRILHVTEAAGSGTLGIVHTLSERLVAAGHAVALAYGRRPETPTVLEALLPPGVEIVPLPWSRRSVLAQVRAAAALRRLTADWRPDVVHLHSSFAGAVGVAALSRDLPRVYTPHGSMVARRDTGPLRRHAFRLAERQIARRADAVGAVSAAEADLLAGAVGAASRIAVVPNGIPELDPGRRPAPAVRREPLVVGMGRVGPARRPAGSARILAAVADLAAVRWIGAAPDDEAAPLARAGVPLTGWLPHDRATAELGAATVLLHWSAWDGAPLAVLEAMARDVVVVASDIAANRELLGPEQVCSDEDGAVALIRRLLQDGDARTAMLDEQRRRGAARGAAAMAAGWTDLYETVVREWAPGRRQRFRPAVAAPTIGNPWI